MRATTITRLRKHFKDYFDAVEGGSAVRILRNGKAIAEILPVCWRVVSWKRQVMPLTVKGLSLSREILNDRGESM